MPFNSSKNILNSSNISHKKIFHGVNKIQRSFVLSLTMDKNCVVLDYSCLSRDILIFCSLNIVNSANVVRRRGQYHFKWLPW